MKWNSTKLLIILVSSFHSLTVSAGGELKPLTESEMGQAVYVSNALPKMNQITVAPAMIEMDVGNQKIPTQRDNASFTTYLPADTFYEAPVPMEYTTSSGFTFGVE